MKVSTKMARERRTQEKRVLVSRSEEERVESLLFELSEELECRVCFSDLVRAGLRVLEEVRAGMVRRARKAGPMLRPKNGNMRDHAEFEEEIAGMFKGAVRARPRIK